MCMKSPSGNCLQEGPSIFCSWIHNGGWMPGHVRRSQVTSWKWISKSRDHLVFTFFSCRNRLVLRSHIAVAVHWTLTCISQEYKMNDISAYIVSQKDLKRWIIVYMLLHCDAKESRKELEHSKTEEPRRLFLRRQVWSWFTGHVCVYPSKCLHSDSWPTFLTITDQKGGGIWWLKTADSHKPTALFFG